MAAKICPFLNQASINDDAAPWLMCDNGVINSEGVPDEYKRPCALWENGDCGLKVAHGDRGMKMWEAFKAYCVDSDTPKDVISLMRRMDKIEAETGKD